ncbi:MAG: AarF/ABC1/UbiB kinase family protein [Saprospiraceae bacterium]|nr:AarF/ABC1/UbiB kinase family protein [Saprospiraceae bacterium]MCF8251993.1 AarF/ABC1/UbiB kinase family protein [Saprospiraceae bacterium]MCF8281672.1 AarF/ABC1/UbiB kinase family protein [Bacteroidales bacterium]MCF8313660.1 AarF/ABC1/UbiB kinase family protein [Saprospiraceae bacterium]MCF8442367.1 AarF/ABC1/UbiB kinase family protein [Saprospiraceae bacterium]
MTATNSHKPTLIGRYEKVIGVLVKYGFADVVTHPPFSRFVPKWKKLIPKHEGVPVTEFTRYELIRMVCEELGTTFIKFAQIASNRPDILPEELIEELQKFQDQAMPVPVENVQGTLEQELGEKLEKSFESIDFQPIASASMAQVHRAVLVGRKEVVLKVQRPGIEDTVALDIQILKSLARLVESRFPQFDAYQPMELVKMFETSIRKELDFTMEAANMRRFEEQFKGNPDIYVPTVYPEFSTEKVLCMEYIDGLKCTDLVALEGIGMTGAELAFKGINLYFEQVFDHGFFHADPHPGNIFVLRDQRVCFIDYGMMGTVMEGDREMLADLLLAVHDHDVDGLKTALLRFSWDEAKIDHTNLEYDINEFFQNYSNIGLEEINSNEVMAALNSLFFEYKIKVPSNLLLLLKALVIIEGVGLMLDPKYNIIENIHPFVVRLLRRKYSPAKLSKKMVKTFGDLTKLATSLPEDIEDIIGKLKQGKLHIEFEHRGLAPLNHAMEAASKRISFAVVLGSLILGSSLLVIADVPPHIKNVPALGVFGFVIAGIFGLRWLASIWKQGKF